MLTCMCGGLLQMPHDVHRVDACSSISANVGNVSFEHQNLKPSGTPTHAIAVVACQR